LSSIGAGLSGSELGDSTIAHDREYGSVEPFPTRRKQLFSDPCQWLTVEKRSP
jgi:hypothetical protein